MRYYHYGDDALELPLESNGVRPVHADTASYRDRDLIVEDDTIYEIDRECINCKQEKKKTAECFFAE